MPILSPAGTAGAIVRGPFSVAFNTPGLTTGVTLFTPAVGDIIVQIMAVITTAFDGTTPKGDVGTFTGNNGIWQTYSAGTLNLTAQTLTVNSNTSLRNVNQTLWASSSVAPMQQVISASPILAVVSQTGLKGGAATGATVGLMKWYFLIAPSS